ncbi:unnamed protein product [Paramecium octaurelia]|uniref:Uncharacterized protein n=1 Tax=Paramecium octaurelia TaxID=43137 RepID=A0A8S1V875_PAROT|nr:unnamed protein product [Paramecium octaurelia]
MHLQKTLSIYLQQFKIEILIRILSGFLKIITRIYIFQRKKVVSSNVLEDWHFRVWKISFGCVKLKKEFQKHSICQKDLCIVPSLLNYFSNYSFRRLLIPFKPLEQQNYQLLYTILFI